MRLSSSSNRPRFEATSKVTSESVDLLSLGLESFHRVGHLHTSYAKGPPDWDGPVICSIMER